MASSFSLLLNKNIYAILDGDTKLVNRDEIKLGMPYLTGTQICDICSLFGLSLVAGASRWTYIEELLKYAIEKNRCDEVLNYFFRKEGFNHLVSLDSPEEIDRLYEEIVTAAISKINTLLALGGNELQWTAGHFYICETGKTPSIETPRVKELNIPYVHGLKERCDADFAAGNYDSVITKSRTLIEEILIHILEENNVANESSGDLIKLYNQVKDLYNMKGNGNFDQRVNSLLNGLEKIVQAVAEMRNINSDAHGSGNNRVTIKEREARLTMNAVMIFCEYILEIHDEHMNAIL